MRLRSSLKRSSMKPNHCLCCSTIQHSKPSPCFSSIGSKIMKGCSLKPSSMKPDHCSCCSTMHRVKTVSMLSLSLKIEVKENFYLACFTRKRRLYRYAALTCVSYPNSCSLSCWHFAGYHGRNGNRLSSSGHLIASTLLQVGLKCVVCRLQIRVESEGRYRCCHGPFPSARFRALHNPYQAVSGSLEFPTELPD